MAEDIVELLRSPIFWFSTVVVGVIVGIAGNFATTGINKLWARFSAQKKKLLQDEEEAFNENVKELLDNPALVSQLQTNMVYMLLKSTLKLVFILIISEAGIPFLIDLGPFRYIFGSSFFYEGILPFVFLFLSVFATSEIITTFRQDRYGNKLLKAYEEAKEKNSKPAVGKPQRKSK